MRFLALWRHWYKTTKYTFFFLGVKNQGFAFHEHNGYGNNNTKLGAPFTNFWFDDNWLARYASQAYFMGLPNGLTSYQNFTRWQIMGGDTSYWTPYMASADYID